MKSLLNRNKRQMVVSFGKPDDENFQEFVSLNNVTFRESIYGIVILADKIINKSSDKKLTKKIILDLINEWTGKEDTE